MPKGVWVVADSDTGVVQKELGEIYTVLEDFLCCKKDLPQVEIELLTYSKKKRETKKGDYVHKIFAWKDFRGTRKIRHQCHKIRKEGSLGFRDILFERHNGKVVRP